ncbi:hypothetical protein DEO72_LG11g2683 [Vigna unguiculata]|uniref:Uncharacterized protein n=1 Tax=Vigna unguiculata TaxID=3917 RepID=A0A4D6NRW1_VIGUN|nr:hypothetical protein DEO72_LG11g2683 [Vigna unguiculata]
MFGFRPILSRPGFRVSAYILLIMLPSPPSFINRIYAKITANNKTNFGEEKIVLIYMSGGMSDRVSAYILLIMLPSPPSFINRIYAKITANNKTNFGEEKIVLIYMSGGMSDRNTVVSLNLSKRVLLGFRVQTDPSSARPRSTHGNSGEKLTLSPKRACLAQARLAETSQVHIRALAQVKSSCLNEATSRSGERGSPKRDRVETLTCRYSFSPSEEPHLWARVGLAQARRARLSENSRNQQPPLLAFSPKRGPVA